LRLLLVFAHPSPESYCAALFRAAQETLGAKGHELRVRDLYALEFDPVMQREEWEGYMQAADANARLHGSEIADLRWAEGLILIYPTWWYGPPAILKGWLERIWIPGVAFEIPKSRFGRVTRKLDNIRLFVAITTSGSPWWWLKLIRDPGRSLFTGAMRPLMHPRCRFLWNQLYRMNHCTTRERERFMHRVTTNLGKV
jgi:putative NADPH-quinone reductase